MGYYWLSDLLSIAESNDNEGPKTSKVHESIDFISQYAQHKKLSKILIVGGGSCKREIQILFNSDLDIDQFSTFTCMDLFEPTYFHQFNNSYTINWIKKSLSSSNISKIEHDFDAILCIGAGRYIENCSQIYDELLIHGNAGSLFIVDFMIQSSSLKSSVSHWHKYFSDHWLHNKKEVLDSLDDLTKISMNLGQSLEESSFSSTSLYSPFSSLFKVTNLQSLVFDYIFPFWFKPNADYSQTKSMIIWYLCVICSYTSCEEISNLVSEYPLQHYALTSKYSAHTYVLSAIKA